VPPVQLRRHDLPGPLGERVEVDRAAEQVRPVDRQLLDPPEADEDGPPAHRHHEPERARRLAPDRGQQHDVADPPDEEPGAVDQRSPLQAGREDLPTAGAAITGHIRRNHPPIMVIRPPAHSSHSMPLPSNSPDMYSARARGLRQANPSPGGRLRGPADVAGELGVLCMLGGLSASDKCHGQLRAGRLPGAADGAGSHVRLAFTLPPERPAAAVGALGGISP
jgi:hypothetical protein